MPRGARRDAPARERRAGAPHRGGAARDPRLRNQRGPRSRSELLGDRDRLRPGRVPRAVAALSLQLDVHLADLVRGVRVEIDRELVQAVVVGAHLAAAAAGQERPAGGQVAQIHARADARRVVDVDRARQARRHLAVDQSPVHRARAGRRVAEERVRRAEVDAVLGDLDAVVERVGAVDRVVDDEPAAHGLLLQLHQNAGDPVVGVRLQVHGELVVLVVVDADGAAVLDPQRRAVAVAVVEVHAGTRAVGVVHVQSAGEVRLDLAAGVVELQVAVAGRRAGDERPVAEVVAGAGEPDAVGVDHGRLGGAGEGHGGRCGGECDGQLPAGHASPFRVMGELSQ